MTKSEEFARNDKLRLEKMRIKMQEKIINPAVQKMIDKRILPPAKFKVEWKE